MDGSAFDAWTKQRLSTRRRLLGALAAGGFLGASVQRTKSTVAQGSTCSLDLQATVRLGPSAGQVLEAGGAQPGQLGGRLRFVLTEHGSLERGTLVLADRTRFAVVGDATGHTLTLRIVLNDEQTLVAVGVGESPIASCQGRIDGLVTGPLSGDLGDWRATMSGLAGEATGDEEASGNQPGSGGGTSGGSGAATVTPTATVNPCPDGEVQCGNFCRDLSYDDFHCGRCDNPCPATTHYCEEGVCVEAVCPPGTTNCFGYCADLSSSTAHCGTCGTTCGAGQSCCFGVCKDLATSPENCGACGNDCGDAIACCNGVCVELGSDLANCGNCNVACDSMQDCISGLCRECTPSPGRCGTNTRCCRGLVCREGFCRVA
jgi:hypothetical protein